MRSLWDEAARAAAPALFVGELRPIRRYQQDDALADNVQARVHEALEDGCRVLIGHSLGSVAAYEIACAGGPAPCRC
jgi:hypothetical protein